MAALFERIGFMTDREFTNIKLDERFRYDGKDLGAVCEEDRTTFKVWSPAAERIVLRLYREDKGAHCMEREMICGEKGVWELAFERSLHGTYYDYLVRIDGADTVTADPYARACGCNGARSMVVDLRLTDPEGFERDCAPKAQEEQIIYELHIKDFSYDRDQILSFMEKKIAEKCEGDREESL